MSSSSTTNYDTMDLPSQQQQQHQHSVMVSSTIRTIVGLQAKVYTLASFVQTYAPSLKVGAPISLLPPNDEKDSSSDTISRAEAFLLKRFHYTLVSPCSDSLKPLLGNSNCKPSRHQELETLVNDVICSLVSNRSKHKRMNPYDPISKYRRYYSSHNNKINPIQPQPQPSAQPNVLSQGYVLASEQLQQKLTPCSNMPNPNIMCHRLNGNVTFCQTSRFFRELHHRLGDDVLRMILLKTRLFVPMMDMNSEMERNTVANQASPNNNYNYIMVCGPAPTRPYHNGLVPASPADAATTETNCKITTVNKNATTSLADAAYTTAPSSQRKVRRHRKRKAKSQSSSSQEDNNASANNRTTGNSLVSPFLEPTATINRQSLFYNGAYVPKVGLPHSHILNSSAVKSHHIRAQQLLHHIFHPFHDDSTTNNKTSNIKTTRHDKTGQKQPSPKPKPKRHSSKKWNHIRVEGLPICQDLLKRHDYCDYHRLLERYCPLPSHCRPKKNHSSTASEHPTLAELSAAYTPADAVVQFLKSVLGIVFPHAFWGSDQNFQQFLQVVEIFVKLRRHEDLPNKTILHKIRVTDFTWLQKQKQSTKSDNDTVGDPRNEANLSKTWKRQATLDRFGHEALTRKVTTLLRWVFSQFIIPLLRSCFYVTETEFGGQQVFYYRKPVWSMFRSLSMKHLLTKQYKEISVKEASKRLSQQELGCSRLRLLPKSTGVRPIATMCKRDESIVQDDLELKSDKPKSMDNEDVIEPPNKKVCLRPNWNENRLPSTNEVLRNASEALKYEYEKNPHHYGVGLSGLHNEFYPRFRQFVDKIRRGKGLATSSNNKSKLFFASVDVRHCYDNIDQDRMLHLMKDTIVSKDNYVVHRHAILHAARSADRVVKRNKTTVGPPETFEIFQKVPQSMGKSNERGGNVLLDETDSNLVTKEKIMALLREHLKSNFVVAKGRYGNRYLLQVQGIPQGSVLSSFLCNFYYGNVEQSLLSPELKSTGAHKSSTELHTATHVHLLVRMMDDFLLVTTDQQMHRMFMQTMYNGDPSCGVHINREKIFSSHDVTLTNGNDGATQHVKGWGADNERWFPWCGMLFHTNTCEISIDYDRFAGEKATNSLTVSRSDKPGEQLNKLLKTFVRPRCQPILFDSFLNCPMRMKVSFFDLMILCAIKTEEYFISSGMVPCMAGNAAFLLNCLEDIMIFALGVIRSRLRDSVQDVDKPHNTNQTCFSKRVAMSLGWKAYFVAFQNGKSLDDFLPYVRKKLEVFRGGPTISELETSGSQMKLILGYTMRYD